MPDEARIKPDSIAGVPSLPPSDKAQHIDTTHQENSVSTHVLKVDTQRNTQSDVFDRLLIREPIYDQNGKTLAVEIRPRISLETKGDDTTLIAALYSLTDQDRHPRHPLLAAIDLASLADQDINYLPPQHIILTIDSPPHPDSRALQLIKARQQAGFRIMLEHRRGTNVPAALAGLVREARLSTHQINVSQLDSMVEQLRHLGMQFLIANHIHCQETQDICSKFRFDGFQGSFSQQYHPGQTRLIEANRLTIMELIDRIIAGNNTDQIEAIIRNDARLCYQMLACVPELPENSPGITSLSQAIQLLRPEGLYNWLTMLLRISTTPSNTSRTHLRRALNRAHLLEALAKKSLNPIPPQTAWLIGLLSVSEALLHHPAQQCMKLLPIADDIKQAITHQRGNGGLLLKLAIATENADQAAIEALAARCLVSLENVHLSMVNAVVLSESVSF